MISDLQHVRVRAPYAMFTRPEYRTERVSDVVGSHAAYEGLLSQIMGHKGCRYEITRIGLLFLPRYLSVTGNELRSFGNGTRPVNTEGAQRTLRTSLILAGKLRRVPDELRCRPEDPEMINDAGVDYVVSFRLHAPEPKYYKMLRTRLVNGRYYGTQPYLGMREFVARIDQVEDLRAVRYPEYIDAPPPIVHPDGLQTASYDADLGFGYYGCDWDDPKRPHYFYAASVRQGVVTFPSWHEVRKFGLKREAA